MVKNMRIDILAFSPHPDDAEMGCGGLLLKSKNKGYSTGIVDLTEAELSTNGDIRTRRIETGKASELLGLDIRENLGLQDCNIKNDPESRLKIIEVVRRLKPSMIVFPYLKDRHPDHENSHKLIKDSVFTSGLGKFITGTEPHRPKVSICYMLNHHFRPSFIVDISDFYRLKMKACKAYNSQFNRDAKEKKKTFINSGYFQDFVENRDKCYGLRIKVKYGEPYFVDGDICIEDPVTFFNYFI